VPAPHIPALRLGRPYASADRAPRGPVVGVA